jgi:hypothetical protein
MSTLPLVGLEFLSLSFASSPWRVCVCALLFLALASYFFAFSLFELALGFFYVCALCAPAVSCAFARCVLCVCALQASSFKTQADSSRPYTQDTEQDRVGP